MAGSDKESGLSKKDVDQILKPQPAEKQAAVGVYPKADPRPVETFKDCAECPEMVVIPPGRFRMGDLSGGGAGAEKPVHAINIGYQFAVGKFKVTFDEWAACVADGGCGGHRPGDRCHRVYIMMYLPAVATPSRSPGYTATDGPFARRHPR